MAYGAVTDTAFSSGCQAIARLYPRFREMSHDCRWPGLPGYINSCLAIDDGARFTGFAHQAIDGRRPRDAGKSRARKEEQGPRHEWPGSRSRRCGLRLMAGAAA